MNSGMPATQQNASHSTRLAKPANQGVSCRFNRVLAIRLDSPFPRRKSLDSQGIIQKLFHSRAHAQGVILPDGEFDGTRCNEAGSVAFSMRDCLRIAGIVMDDVTRP